MRVPLSWLRDHVSLPESSPKALANRLTEAGLKVEHVEETGGDIEGVVVARVVEIEELTDYKKPIRWVTLVDGSDQRQVICGATNFAVGDVIAYARPPATLPGGFAITKRRAYDRERGVRGAKGALARQRGDAQRLRRGRRAPAPAAPLTPSDHATAPAC